MLGVHRILSISMVHDQLSSQLDLNSPILFLNCSTVID